MEVYTESVKKMDLTKISESDEHAKRAAVNLLVRTITDKSTFTPAEVRKVLRDPSKNIKTLHPKQQDELLRHITTQMDAARVALAANLPKIQPVKNNRVTIISPINDLKREKALDAFRKIRSEIAKAQYLHKKEKAG